MLQIKKIDIEGYEQIVEGIDPECGLHCFIAVHSCALGPSLGGTRIQKYSSTQDALADAMRLAKAMTYKSATAQLGLGGGKSVIIADPHSDKTPALLHAFGEVVNSLKGKYIAAEDAGSTIEDIATIGQVTPYVAALMTDKSSGDPSYFTAWGVLRGMQAVAKEIWESPSLYNKTIAIQGVGSVGSKLAHMLFWEGANLILSDIDEHLVHQLARRYGARIVSPQEILKVECDILAPCALGNVFSNETVQQLNCNAIAGAANNQLASPDIGHLLMHRHILYAPDYIINAGGVINAAAEFAQGGYDPKATRENVDQIYYRLVDIFDRSKREHKSTNIIADEIAEHNVKFAVGRRLNPIDFHLNNTK